MRVSFFCPYQKIHLPSIYLNDSKHFNEEAKRFTESSQRYLSDFAAMKLFFRTILMYRDIVGYEDVNIRAIKQLVNVFSSVVASRSLLFLEKHMLENLSYLETVYDLIGDLNNSSNVCLRKFIPSTPVSLIFCNNI